MGASQSQKKRKEKRKRKRNSSIIHEIPRSASFDILGTMNRSRSRSLVSCPHCQHSLSWSQSLGEGWKESPYNHRCLHGQYEEMRRGGAGIESCPNCYSIGQSSGALQPASSHGASMLENHRQPSTMSLNRPPFYHQTVPGMSVEGRAGDLHFSQLLQIMERQKENGMSLRGAASYTRTSATPTQTLSTPSTFNSATVGSLASSSSSSSSLTRSHPPSSSLQQSAADNHYSVDKDKKVCVLDDEESKKSRWVKRKQMAQQLRDLRRHLESKELASLYAPLLSAETGNGTNRCADSHFSGLNGSSQHSKDGTSSDGPGERTFPTNPPTSADAQPMAASPTRRCTRSKFSRMSNYRYLDNHPVMTKLQNEQNNRLESMERRMKEIRISAMQEAERRKFAEIFPAKNNDSETQRMLDEAKETLEKLKEEKRKKMLSHQGQQSPQGHQEHHLSSSQSGSHKDLGEGATTQQDSGEIIPVCVVPQRGCKSLQTKFRGIKGNREKSKEAEKSNKPLWLKSDWPEINLNQPLTWLLLPFLLFPLILRMFLALIINTSTTTLNERTRRGSSSDSVEERNRRRSSDSHPGVTSSRLGSKRLS